MTTVDVTFSLTILLLTTKRMPPLQALLSSFSILCLPHLIEILSYYTAYDIVAFVLDPSNAYLIIFMLFCFVLFLLSFFFPLLCAYFDVSYIFIPQHLSLVCISGLQEQPRQVLITLFRKNSINYECSIKNINTNINLNINLNINSITSIHIK